MTTLGQRLKAAIDMKGINQSELADLLDTTEISVSRYINDIRQPKADMIVKICRVLNISSDWLLGIKETKKTTTIYDKKILNKLKMAEEIIDIVNKYNEET